MSSASLWWLWMLWVLVVVWLTTTPWSDFQGHSHWEMVRWIPFEDASLKRRFFIDVVSNILLFVPFGYLYGRARATAGRGLFLRVILFAALLSAATELFQVYMHNRIPAMTDVCTNVIGAVIGVAAATRLTRR